MKKDYPRISTEGMASWWNGPTSGEMVPCFRKSRTIANPTASFQHILKLVALSHPTFLHTSAHVRANFQLQLGRWMSRKSDPIYGEIPHRHHHFHTLSITSNTPNSPVPGPYRVLLASPAIRYKTSDQASVVCDVDISPAAHPRPARSALSRPHPTSIPDFRGGSHHEPRPDVYGSNCMLVSRREDLIHLPKLRLLRLTGGGD